MPRSYQQGRPIKKKNGRPHYHQATCEANQQALDRLIEKQERAHGNFVYTLKRAIESLQKANDPIQTYAEALTLPFVGPTIAKLIVPPEKTTTTTTTTLRCSTTVQSSSSSLLSDTGESCIQRKELPNNYHQIHLEHTNSCLQETTQSRKRTIEALEEKKKTKKQLAVEQAQAQALDWTKERMVWRVVLLIDVREQERNKMRSACQQSGIPTEERTLPIGDMAWIAQGIRDGQVREELLLGTIVERKSAEDLKASLFGTRYMEQRKRLKETGIAQVVFLIEGDITKDQHRCSADTLLSALWEIRLHTGFQILQTKHMDDTVVTLKRMHRRILQRTFPTVFSSSEALPNFNQVAVQTDIHLNENDMLVQNRRHRRKRMQSLMEMTFDCDPIPPFGTQRFMTYSELKAIVERDREITNRRIGSLHGFMLKQVNTVNAKKIVRLQELYPTTCHLLEAFDACPIDQRSHLLSEVVVSEGARTTKIGPRSSTELHVAYGLAMRDDESRSCSTLIETNTSCNESTGSFEATHFGKENMNPRTEQLLAEDSWPKRDKFVAMNNTGSTSTSCVEKSTNNTMEYFHNQVHECLGKPTPKEVNKVQVRSLEKAVIHMLDDDSEESEDELRPILSQTKTANLKKSINIDAEVIIVD